MEITEVFYPKNRQEWRDWLVAHHVAKSEIWLRTFRKSTGKPSLPYDDMVEECLCFGWIDGIVKKLDAESTVRRITPRRKKSFLSELNRQRIWKLQRLGLMTQAGIDPIADQVGHPDDPLDIPDWLLAALQLEPPVWDTFDGFPHHYKRLKIGWVSEPRGSNSQVEAQKRLDNLIKMTRQGKMYGTIP